MVNSGGTITGVLDFDAIDFRAGGTLTNGRGGLVSGGSQGVVISGTGVVTNAGSIGGGFDGVRFYSDGTLTNAATGIISGEDGVSGDKGSTVTNSGAIIGTFLGVYVSAGVISNRAGATITGGVYGVAVSNGGTIINAGTVVVTGTSGSTYSSAAAATYRGGTLTNLAGGAIEGGRYGFVALGSGNVTITDAGTISGSQYAVKFDGTGSGTLILDPGAVLVGKVGHGTSATASLVLASAASTGTITGLGTQFLGFKTVTENTGAKWVATGANSLGGTTALTIDGTFTDTGSLVASGKVTVGGTLSTSGTGTVQLSNGVTLLKKSVLTAASTGSIEIGAIGGVAKGVVTVDAGATLVGAGTIRNTVVDKGSIDAKGGTLTLTGSISGTGAVSITSNAVLSIGGSAGVTGLTFLAGGHETASFGAPTLVSATFSGFAATDTIDLLGFTASKLAFAGHTLTVHGSGGSVAHLNFAGTYKTAQFAFGTDHHGGTNITFV